MFDFVKQMGKTQVALSINLNLGDIFILILIALAIAFCILGGSFYVMHRRRHPDNSVATWLFETDDGKQFLLSCLKPLFPLGIVAAIFCFPIILAVIWSFDFIRNRKIH